MVLFEDETGFSLHPKLGRIWGKKGTKSYIYTKSQHHKRLNLFGWVDPLNGFHGVMKWVRGNTDGFLKMLAKIVSRFRGVIRGKAGQDIRLCRERPYPPEAV